MTNGMKANPRNVEIGKQMYEQYQELGTLQEVADLWGMTREAVRQYIKVARPDYKPNEAWAERRAQTNEERLYQEFYRRAQNAVECPLCGFWVLRQRAKANTRNRLCSTGCTKDWQVLRLVLDEEEYTKWRRHVAERMLHESPYPHQRRWAERVLAGQEPSGVRYVIRGSRTHKLALKYGLDVQTADEVEQWWDRTGGSR